MTFWAGPEVKSRLVSWLQPHAHWCTGLGGRFANPLAGHHEAAFGSDR
jgi:hypothetical protein